MAADYDMTAELLASHNIAPTVSEIHGVLSGQICAGNTGYDLGLSLKILEINSDIEEVITNLLKMLAEDIQDQFQAQDYVFQPLLPDDEAALTLRLEALAQWCDGFNAGFAGAWVKDDGAMSTETREVLDDFSRIAQLDMDDEEVSEKESEVNYMEIAEYTRMAAITVYLQNSTAPSPSPGIEDLPDDNYIH